jgi:hypothetical protein
MVAHHVTPAVALGRYAGDFARQGVCKSVHHHGLPFGLVDVAKAAVASQA